MSDYSESAARFARDTAAHEMVIVHDDGVYRHLAFREPSHGYYWFELITTPGQLIFSGDGTSYVFRRSPDMFEFFRSGIWRDGSHHINPGYWSEKLTSGREAATSYSMKLFEEEIAETLTAVEDDYPGIKAAWMEHVESEFNIEYEEEARRAVSEFRFGEARRAKCRACDWEFEDESFTAAVSKAAAHRRAEGEKHSSHVTDLTFTFSDMEEVQFQDFDWWFLWACQAILWGIARYDRMARYGLRKLATVQHDGVRFEEPAPRAPHGVKARQAFADDLRGRPGTWALLGTYRTSGSARQAAYSIRCTRGVQDGPFSPAGSFEADARTMLGEHRVYVRFVGGESE